MSDNTSVPEEAVQTAVYTLLNGVITGGVYDEVPAEASHPYTTIGFLPDSEFEARQVKGRLTMLVLKTFSKDAGGKFEAYGIMKEIVEKMTLAKLSMTGWKEIWKTYRSGAVVRLEKEPGVNYQGTVTFLICVCKST